MESNPYVKGPKPDDFPWTFYGFDHCGYWVGNAYQAAKYYVSRFGFQPLCQRVLETGERNVACHVVQKNKILLEFKSPILQNSEMAAHQDKHGDGVKDIAFTVDDCKAIYNYAIKHGAKSVKEPTELKDSQGSVIIATVQTYGDTLHTLVQRNNYKGVFLPGYSPEDPDPINETLPDTLLEVIDHCVGNMPDKGMTPTVKFYENVFRFRQFWCVDDKMIHTQFSALRSTVMTDCDENIKMPINEPANGLRKSQIQEYVEYYNGAGVQHVALLTDDIVTSVKALRKRGLNFLKIPSTYYRHLEKRLGTASIKVKEDLKVLEELQILVDFDDKGYLLQIFTQCVQDRPTLFYEIIQRRNHTGFGAGNFKALFESIEEQQKLRGNL